MLLNVTATIPCFFFFSLFSRVIALFFLVTTPTLLEKNVLIAVFCCHLYLLYELYVCRIRCHHPVAPPSTTGAVSSLACCARLAIRFFFPLFFSFCRSIYFKSIVLFCTQITSIRGVAFPIRRSCDDVRDLSRQGQTVRLDNKLFLRLQLIQFYSLIPCRISPSILPF